MYHPKFDIKCLLMWFSNVMKFQMNLVLDFSIVVNNVLMY